MPIAYLCHKCLYIYSVYTRLFDNAVYTALSDFFASQYWYWHQSKKIQHQSDAGKIFCNFFFFSKTVERIAGYSFSNVRICCLPLLWKGCVVYIHIWNKNWDQVLDHWTKSGGWEIMMYSLYTVAPNADEGFQHAACSSDCWSW